MTAPARRGWRTAWWPVWAVVALAVLSMATGFVWLPLANPDFAQGGLWDAICRAAGVPSKWDETDAGPTGPSSLAVMTPALARASRIGDAGRGATLANARCTMCHGPRAPSETNAPNLAGQYPEVVYKQLLDYRSGHRTHALMQALAVGLADQEVRDLAAYYGGLPKFTPIAPADRRQVPALIRVGDPMRNIAPCASCHGGYDQKLGSPWLEGMPQEYLAQQLRAFASGARRNDSHGVMRNVARQLSGAEIDQLARFYASRPGERAH